MNVRDWCRERIAALRDEDDGRPVRDGIQERVVLAHFAERDPDPAGFPADLRRLADEAYARGREDLGRAALRILAEWERR